MKSKGHDLLVVARDREVIHKLLEAEKIKYKDRGKGAKSFFGKILYTIKADAYILYYSIKFKPDIYLSHSSHYNMHIAKIMRKPCIVTGDSDHIKLNAKWLMPYIDTLLTPSVYKLDYGENHFKFNGYMELLYLHPTYFNRTKNNVRNVLGLENGEIFFLLRFVAWDAFHDTNQGGFTNQQKADLVDFLTTKGRVLISSEGDLPLAYKEYEARIPPELLHDILAEATICISEGATTASEAAVLGTPTVYVNSLEVSYCKEQDIKYNLNHCFKNGHGVIEKVKELLNQKNLKEEFSKRRDKLINDKIDVTEFLVWFIENYPESKFQYKKLSIKK